MSTVALYVFFFMLISSVLGFLTAFVWKHSAVTELKNSVDNAQKNLTQMQTQHDSLQEHAKTIEKEKEKLVYENERLTLKLSMLLGKSKNIKEQKSILESDGYIDTSNLDKKINDLNNQITTLNEEINIVKKESLEWQVQYSEILEEKEALAAQLQQLRNPRN